MFHDLQVPELNVFSVESQILLVWPARMSATDTSSPVSETALASGRRSREKDFARPEIMIVSHSGDYGILEQHK